MLCSSLTAYSLFLTLIPIAIKLIPAARAAAEARRVPYEWNKKQFGDVKNVMVMFCKSKIDEQLRCREEKTAHRSGILNTYTLKRRKTSLTQYTMKKNRTSYTYLGLDGLHRHSLNMYKAQPILIVEKKKKQLNDLDCENTYTLEIE